MRKGFPDGWNFRGIAPKLLALRPVNFRVYPHIPQPLCTPRGRKAASFSVRADGGGGRTERPKEAPGRPRTRGLHGKDTACRPTPAGRYVKNRGTYKSAQQLTGQSVAGDAAQPLKHRLRLAQDACFRRENRIFASWKSAKATQTRESERPCNRA